ncbi:MAG: lysine--tRNA ligase [Pseudomonadales bacterium]|jgi:lysyl-tRNA synthetase class 2|nr:lysine--tRNA ligase [Pseudomonadales bacterium]
MSRLDETILAKKEKRQALEAAGVNVHPYTFDKQIDIAAAKDFLDKPEIVKTAGRIMTMREHGKVTFFNLKDYSGDIQVMIQKEKVGEENYKLLTSVDAGDHLGVSGKVEKTKTGEITIMADEFVILGKALRPLPTAWNAAEDKEARFRKRYVDMLINPRTEYVLKSRWTILRELRAYMQNEGFVEVETPILQPLYGGTNAKPFTTHMNALDCEFYLRVAPELYLKRLMVGGMERVFEIARNFRNEGIDQTHQPEFTMVEWYEAYADYHRMMEIIEGLIKHLNKAVNNSNILKVGDQEIDLDKKWPTYTVKEALIKFVKIDVDNSNDEELKKLLSKHELKLIGKFSRGKAIFALFDKLVCDYLVEPTWIIDYPREVSPLAKTHRTDPALTERYELYIGTKEISDGWSEITDSLDQRARFENEQQNMRDGDDEAQPMDEDFLAAMEHGLPPMGGVGLGIDRLVMLITNEWSIKETIAFPTLRPLNRAPVVENKEVVKPNSGDDKVAFNTGGAGQREYKEETPLDTSVFTREKAEALLNTYVKDEGLLDHNRMVARSLEAYAEKLGKDKELWYQTGLLHDIDLETHPDEHPLVGVNQYLVDYPEDLRRAVHSHGYGTVLGADNSIPPETALDYYITAVDEMCGFLRAVSLIRPTRFEGLEVKSVKKRLKNKTFAAAINRDDIEYGAKIIGVPLDEHIDFMIKAFQSS